MDSRASDLDVSGLAITYRRLVLWFVAHLILPPVGFGLRPLGGEGAVGTLLAFLVVVQLAIVAVLAYNAYRTAVLLGSGAGWVWGIAMLVPVINMVTLLLLSSKATRTCRANGVPVGFLGPKTLAHR